MIGQNLSRIQPIKKGMKKHKSKPIVQFCLLKYRKSLQVFQFLPIFHKLTLLQMATNFFRYNQLVCLPCSLAFFGLYQPRMGGLDETASIYNPLQKHESTLLHTYELNEYLAADRSCTTKYFRKNLISNLFTLLQAPFASKCVNYSSHSELLKFA